MLLIYLVSLLAKSVVILTIAAFEGTAHPYKPNIVRFGNQPVLPSKFPELKEAFKPNNGA